MKFTFYESSVIFIVGVGKPWKLIRSSGWTTGRTIEGSIPGRG